MRTRNITMACVATLALIMGSQTPMSAQEDSLRKEKRMAWFAEAKLGIFIHWGIYAVKGVSESWSFYNNYLPHEEYMKQAVPGV